MNTLVNSNFELIYKINKNEDINVAKELYRGELYCDLLKYFTRSCLKNLDENVFSHKKNYTRTITNMLASWFFTLYQTYDFSMDPFFPSNYLENDHIIIRTLIDYCSLYQIPDINKKIDNIINDLHYSYSIIINKLLSFNNQKIQKVEIIKKEINCVRNNQTISFYNFHIKNYNSNKCNKLYNMINNIMLPIELYYKMLSRFVPDGNDVDIDTIIWIILFRYQLLSSNNNQLAVLPSIYNKMKNDFNLSVECFASAINTSLPYFCSLYYDVEKYFGSIGNFFNIIPISGTFSFNPPYQYDIISNGIKTIIQHMDHTTKPLTFIITIPIWDNFGKSVMADNMTENNNNKINYQDFTIMNDIRSSKYFKGLRMISKNDFTYMDHNFYLFKNKTIQNTYVIVMTNINDCNFINVINNYDFFNST